MTDKDESTGCTCGCGCIIILFWLTCLMFAISWCVKACESKSLWKGGVETVKEYYMAADSIWNGKED